MGTSAHTRRRRPEALTEPGPSLGAQRPPGPAGDGSDEGLALWWHCPSGIAGDMALASLLDSGADLAEVQAGLRCLPVTGWDLGVTKVEKGGIAASYVSVDLGPAAGSEERTWSSVQDIVGRAQGLPPRARLRALEVFAALARAEAEVHGIAPGDVHFHEVGALDAIVDIVGTCLALESLGVSSVHASSVALGSGSTRSAHGALPNPAPAVMKLLAGAQVHGTSQRVELTTPTGAAILAALATSWGPMPPMRVVASGYGAGTADLPGTANVLQAVLGHAESLQGGGAGTWQDLEVIEANVDDVTGEILAHGLAALMAQGALDAWVTPVTGKKGRPGHVVSVLATQANAALLARRLATETGSLGLRLYQVRRWALPRETVEVTVGGQPIRVKVGPYRAKAEYEDAARAASVLDAPLAGVARRAEEAALQAGIRVEEQGPLPT